MVIILTLLATSLRGQIVDSHPYGGSAWIGARTPQYKDWCVRYRWSVAAVIMANAADAATVMEGV